MALLLLILETLVSQDSLSPTSTQPYVLSYVPTVATDDVLSLADDEVRHEIQYYDISVPYGQGSARLFPIGA